MRPKGHSTNDWSKARRPGIYGVPSQPEDEKPKIPSGNLPEAFASRHRALPDHQKRISAAHCRHIRHARAGSRELLDSSAGECPGDTAVTARMQIDRVISHGGDDSSLLKFRARWKNSRAKGDTWERQQDLPDAVASTYLEKLR
eukprot:Plantae.Rhodophyta-Hildenbrandia_rubra.ctg3936.p1 GENE.Plantae.Rhodophyta-Hildenbrandia_rubra.ctg3936~~Plantae.Rhodophyta-Hildenbrandia_rubra.ctg3936.p1  ORF type:complete len:144 (+),score=5.92 Plantae.Rhodophyta-Hildenbrandia_rubra.ctg3936:476-907(+)